MLSDLFSIDVQPHWPERETWSGKRHGCVIYKVSIANNTRRLVIIQVMLTVVLHLFMLK